MFKFLPGILLIQLVTAGMAILCVSWSLEPQLIIVVVGFCVIIAVLTTLWFGSIVRNVENSAKAQLQAKHAQDREKIIRRAEREKAKVTSESYNQMEKAAKKANAQINFKVGVAFAAATAAGGIIIFSQLVTVGMMVLVASCGGLVGYLLRGRQDRLSWKNQSLLSKVGEPPAKKLGSLKPESTPKRPKQSNTG